MVHQQVLSAVQDNVDCPVPYPVHTIVEWRLDVPVQVKVPVQRIVDQAIIQVIEKLAIDNNGGSR